jgi:hypothetical protein
MHTNKAGQLAIHVKQTPEKLAANASKKKRNQAALGLTARDSVSLKLSSHRFTLSHTAANS